MSQLCKYYKQVRQVSYDSGVTWVNLGEVQKGDLYEYNSPSCGGVVEYRWVNMDSSTDYYCEGTTKYYKQKKQQSTDGASTWQDVSPAEYQRGSVAEYTSTDCGYVPPSPSYSTQYFTIIPRETCTIWFDGAGKSGNKLSYSLDSGSTWTELALNQGTPQLSAGQKVMWKGNCTPYGRPQSGGSYAGIGTFYAAMKTVDLEGNIMSLLFGDNFSGKTSLSGYDYAFVYTLGGTNLGIVDASNLVLPATTLSTHCYDAMFATCTTLTAPPQLPATTLAPYCYYMMFADCTSLTTAPVLPARILAGTCYQYMFSDCTSLNYVKCLATTISATNCTYRWLNGVSSSGTFVKNSSMSGWPSGTSGIPNNWTVQNA